MRIIDYIAQGIIDPTSLPKTSADNTTLNKIFLIIYAILGAIALLVVVLSGARYVLSKGEPDNIQKAKNELKYALMGLVLASIAVALVNFVINLL